MADFTLSFNYMSSSDSYAVIGASGSGDTINIPSTYDDTQHGTKPVTYISRGLLDNITSSSVTTVIIPSSIDTIDSPQYMSSSGIFEGCTNLTSVTFGSPCNFTTIPRRMFKNCINLQSITIPNGVQILGVGGNVNGDGVFSNCAALETVVIPDTVKSVGLYSFYNCTSLSNVTMSKNIEYIYEGCFLGCTSLTNFTLYGYSLQGVGVWAFGKTSSTSTDRSECILNNLTFYGTVSDYYRAIDYFASMTTDLTLSKLPTVNYVNTHETDKIVTFTHPTGTVDIVYQYLTSSTNPKAPSGRAGYYAIATSSYGDTITFADTYNDGVHGSDYVHGSIDDFNILGRSAITSVTLGANVRYVGGFHETGVTSISNLSTLGVSFGFEAFKDCANLTSIDFTKVDIVGSYAFANTGVQTLTLNRGAYYNKYCFSNCHSLTSVGFMEQTSSVRILAPYMFAGCENLETFQSFELYSGSLEGAFQGCSSLTSINIRYQYSAISTVLTNTFKGCTSLQSATFRGDIRHIGDSCFEGCTSLTSFSTATVEHSVSLGARCFYGCTSLTSVNVSKLSGSIPESCFEGCTSLASFSDNRYDTEKFTDYDPASSSDSLRLSARCFYGCISLTSVHIPFITRHIDESAFENCTSLQSIILPGMYLRSIGANAFAGCTSLQYVYYRGFRQQLPSHMYGAPSYYSVVGNTVTSGTYLTACGLPATSHLDEETVPKVRFSNFVCKGSSYTGTYNGNPQSIDTYNFSGVIAGTTTATNAGSYSVSGVDNWGNQATYYWDIDAPIVYISNVSPLNGTDNTGRSVFLLSNYRPPDSVLYVAGNNRESDKFTFRLPIDAATGNLIYANPGNYITLGVYNPSGVSTPTITPSISAVVVYSDHTDVTVSLAVGAGNPAGGTQEFDSSTYLSAYEYRLCIGVSNLVNYIIYATNYYMSFPKMQYTNVGSDGTSGYYSLVGAVQDLSIQSSTKTYMGATGSLIGIRLPVTASYTSGTSGAPILTNDPNVLVSMYTGDQTSENDGHNVFKIVAYNRSTQQVNEFAASKIGEGTFHYEATTDTGSLEGIHSLNTEYYIYVESAGSYTLKFELPDWKEYRVRGNTFYINLTIADADLGFRHNGIFTGAVAYRFSDGIFKKARTYIHNGTEFVKTNYGSESIVPQSYTEMTKYYNGTSWALLPISEIVSCDLLSRYNAYTSSTSEYDNLTAKFDYICSRFGFISEDMSTKRRFKSNASNQGAYKIVMSTTYFDMLPAQFKNCTALAAVTLNGAIAEMPAEYFYGCSNLKDVYFSNITSSQWNDIQKGTDWNTGTHPDLTLHFSDD